MNFLKITGPKYPNIVIFYAVIFLLFSCKDGESEDTPEPIIGSNEVNLESIPGRYRGTWDWDQGTGPITMNVAGSETNEYEIEFFETNSFTPGFNSDFTTPDALGILTMDGNDASISLILRTDSPPCVGSYSGEGTRSSTGTFELEMQVVHDCAQDGDATFTLRKIGN